MNTLFYRDNLELLREHIADESVDLVYLNPTFNSQLAPHQTKPIDNIERGEI